MKRVSIVAIAAIMIAISASPVQATGFEPLGVDGLLRLAGFGFGQGYHSMPCNGALRQSYSRAQCQRFTVVPPPAYPCSPRAPETHNYACSGIQSQQPMAQYAAPHMMNMEVQSPDLETNFQTEDNDFQVESENKWDSETDESENNWGEIPEVNKKKTPTMRPPARDPAEDSPKREPMPKPGKTISPKAEVGPVGEDMLDELDSYFGDGVGPGPTLDHQSQIRRLPPTGPSSTPPAKSEVFTTQPSGGAGAPSPGATSPGATPPPKDSDVWW